jgi:hypothetical protein
MTAAKRKTTAAAATFSLDLPEIWESILTYLNNDHVTLNRTLKSLSVISKQLLSITNRVRFSATVTNRTLLPRFFQRFPNLTSLHVIGLCGDTHVQALFAHASTSSLDITLECSSAYQPTQPPTRRNNLDWEWEWIQDLDWIHFFGA